METQTEIVLPSGALLKIQLAPFAEAKALYKAVLKELKTIKLDMGEDSKRELPSYILEAFCITLSSDEIEAAAHRCMSRCLYNGVRIDMKETWEPVDARGDYTSAMIAIGKENLVPFGKALFAEFKDAVATIETSRRPT